MLLQLPFHGIDPVFLEIGPVQLRWYGLMYMFGFIAAFFVMRRAIRIRRLDMSSDDLYDFLFYMILGLMIGGRLGYIVLYDLSAYIENPAAIVAIWRGGMSFHGGLGGMAVAAAIFVRRRGAGFMDIADLAAVSAPIGLGLGRLGNFINGELFGRETSLPWAMIFPGGGSVGRHPSQLYEAGLEGLVLFIFLGWLYRRELRSGAVFWGLMCGYGLVRFMVEFVREPDSHIGLDLGPLSRGQLLSLPMLLVGATFLIRAVRSSNLSEARSGHPGKRRPKKR
jgi:phosphatidylglycerol:prolipoprotein diacylglycerol transferase